jgi:hypothetical protein
MTEDRFCAICEKKLEVADSEHVCRTCFRKAREPKETSINLSDEGAERLGYAYAFGNFVNWGIQKLFEASGAKMPPPAKTPEEAAQRELEARERLREIQRRLDKDRPSES